MKNLVLIGMPGSGKTAVGESAAKRLRVPFIDIDMEIEKQHGKITEIFKKGEPFFRDIETEMTKKAAMVSGRVVATGGGVVLRKENMVYLKQNGVVFFLDRPLDDLIAGIAIEDRPLLKQGAERLRDLYAKRYTLYQEYADIVIDGSGQMNDVVETVIKQWEEIR